MHFAIVLDPVHTIIFRRNLGFNLNVARGVDLPNFLHVVRQTDHEVCRSSSKDHGLGRAAAKGQACKRKQPLGISARKVNHRRRKLVKLINYISGRPNPSTELVPRGSHVHAVTEIGKLWWRICVIRSGIVDHIDHYLVIQKRKLKGKQLAHIHSQLSRKVRTSKDDEIVRVSGTTQVGSLSRVVVDTRRRERSWLAVVVVENFTIKISRENCKVSIFESVPSEEDKASFLADYWCSRASTIENLRLPKGITIVE